MTVSQKGEVRVDRVVAAVDCGHVVNPGIVEAQIESGVIYGLSAALYGEITIKDGRVEQSNFDAYESSAWPTRRRSRSISRSPAARNGAASASPAPRHRARGRQCGVRGHRHARALAAAQEREAAGPGLTAASKIDPRGHRQRWPRFRSRQSRDGAGVAEAVEIALVGAIDAIGQLAV